MIIKKIKLHNFRNFIRNEFEFECDKLNMIVGHGGSGKTTIVSAIKWLLYGKCPFFIKSDIDLLNIDVKNKMSSGEIQDVYVEMIWENDGKEYRMNRRVVISKGFSNKFKCEDRNVFMFIDGEIVQEIDIWRCVERNFHDELMFIDRETYVGRRNMKKQLETILHKSIEIEVLLEAIDYCKRAKIHYHKVLGGGLSESEIVLNQKIRKRIKYVDRMINDFEILRKEMQNKGKTFIEDEFNRINRELDVSSEEGTLENFFKGEGICCGKPIDLSESKIFLYYISFILACRKARLKNEEDEGGGLPLIIDSIFIMPDFMVVRILEHLSKIGEQVIVLDNSESFINMDGIGTVYRLENNLDGTIATVTKL